MNLQEQIRQIATALRALPMSRKVFIFGSAARGEVPPGGDIDVCVITKPNGKRKIELMREIRQHLAPHTTYPLDILVYNEQEFAARAALSSTFEHQIAEHGMMVVG